MWFLVNSKSKTTYRICSETLAYKIRLTVKWRKVGLWNDKKNGHLVHTQAVGKGHDHLEKKVLQIQLTSKKYLEDPRLLYFQFSHNIAQDYPRRSFHSCNYGIVIGWCPYIPLLYTWCHTETLLQSFETRQLDDIEQGDVACTPVPTYQIEYHGHRWLRAYRSVRRVCMSDFDTWRLLCGVSWLHPARRFIDVTSNNTQKFVTLSSVTCFSQREHLRTFVVQNFGIICHFLSTLYNVKWILCKEIEKL